MFVRPFVGGRVRSYHAWRMFAPAGSEELHVTDEFVLDILLEDAVHLLTQVLQHGKLPQRGVHCTMELEGDRARTGEVGHLFNRVGDDLGVHDSTLPGSRSTLHCSAALLEAIGEHPEVGRVGQVVPPPTNSTDQLVDGVLARAEGIHVVVGEEADRGALRGGEGLAVVEERDDVLHGPSIPFPLRSLHSGAEDLRLPVPDAGVHTLGLQVSLVASILVVGILTSLARDEAVLVSANLVIAVEQVDDLHGPSIPFRL
jgi:hypothetical protein